MRSKLSLIILLALVFAGCTDDLEVGDPEAFPTWEFTGPTLEVTRPPVEAPDAFNDFGITGGIGQNNPTAAALPAHSNLPPIVLNEIQPGLRSVQITLSSERVTTGYFFENPPFDFEGRVINVRHAGVLLIGAPLQAWGDFPNELMINGHSVLIVETGDDLFVEDFLDMLGALQASGSVDPGALGVIGSGRGADVALLACADDIRCDAVVLLSPLGDNTSADAIRQYEPRPAFIAASSEDTESYRAAQEIAFSGGDLTELSLLINAGHGAQMMQNERLRDEVIDWIREILFEELSSITLEDDFDPAFDFSIDDFDRDFQAITQPDLDAPIGSGLDFDFDFDFPDDDEFFHGGG